MNRIVFHIRGLGIGRRQLFPLVCFVIAVGFCLWAAYMADDKPWWVIGNLAFLVLALAVMNALSSALNWSVIEHGSELLGYWKKDQEYTQALLVEHVDLMAELGEHDPEAAERRREKFAAKLLEHHPGLEDELDRIRKTADWN